MDFVLTQAPAIDDCVLLAKALMNNVPLSLYIALFTTVRRQLQRMRARNIATYFHGFTQHTNWG